MTQAVFITVVLARFFVPLLIPRFPLPAVVACLVIDAADQSIFQMFTDDPLEGYQSYDKALDVYYLAIAYISTMRNWREPVAFEISRFLYLYRLVGVTMFELTQQRWMLLVFPNTFEYFFIAYEAIRVRNDPTRLSARFLLWMTAFIWIVIKLPQEWWIHVAQLDFTDFMNDHPEAWFLIGGAAIALVVVIYTQRRRIPPADWPYTFAVDRHLPALDDSVTGREPFFTAILLEKVVFLGLLSVIFAQVLPDVRATNLGLVLGVAALVVINAAVSQALRRRGRSWATTFTQFLAMLAINLGIAALDVILGPRSRGDTPAVNTMFFMLLLSLMIALFDRFRATRRGHDAFGDIRAALRRQKAARPA